MEGQERGLRSVLEPALYIGVAAILHGLLFLIPAGGPGKRDADTSRGIRVKTYIDGPPAAAPSAPARPAPTPRTDFSTPSTAANRDFSLPGRDTVAPGGRSGEEGGPSGQAGPSQGPVVGSGGPVSQSEYGQYLSRLRSDGVQGWARQSAKASRMGWKGSGTPGGAEGWGSGAGTGTGGWKGAGRGPGSGGGPPGQSYLDPRVKMVVILYPLDANGNTMVDKASNVENRYRQIQYPEHKVKQAQFTAGWWNVYVELRTGPDGKVTSYRVLRPETEGPLERIFVDQVRRDMERWSLDPSAEIHVDVRFYVE